MELPQETLGLLLIRAGLVTRSQLYEGLRRQRRTGERIGEALIALGLISSRDVSETLAHQLGTPLIDSALAVELAEAHRELVPPGFVEETGAVPIGERDGSLVFAVAARTAISSLETTELLPKAQFGIYLVPDHDFGRVLSAHHGSPVGDDTQGPVATRAPSMTFHGALEKLYEATDLPTLAHAIGVALQNFFSRVAVLAQSETDMTLLDSLGFQAIEGAALPHDPSWLSPGTYYGPLANGPDEGKVANALGCDPSQTGLIWLTEGLPGRGFIIYGDHGGTGQVYDDLQDLEGLFNEVKTALELLNNESG